MNKLSFALLTLMWIAVPAAADDDQDTADTIASTWSGGALRLAADDKRFVLALTTLHEGLRVRGEASAPLDEDTRTAAFVGKNGLAPGFRGRLYVGYDSTYAALDLTPSDQELLSYCESHHISPCLQSTAEKVRSEKAALVERADEPLVRDGQPRARAQLLWGVGVNVSYAYDRKSAFVDEVAAEPQNFSANDFQVDASAVMTWPTRVTVSLRGGYERANRVALADFRRCTALPSTDMTVTGQVCSDEKFLVNDPNPVSSVHGRLAVAYYPASSPLARYLAAAELRTNFENLSSDDASLDVHLLGFLHAIDLGAGSARIGLGVTVRTALVDSAGADRTAGETYDYSLFGVVGTSF